MCFYYSIIKKPANALINGKVVETQQLSLFDEHYIVNGFDHPSMPIITDANPNEISYVQWGFLPSNLSSIEKAPEFLGKYNTLNAKVEDIMTSKLYAESFQNRRCLVLCSGFFEWRVVKKEKIPYYITLKNDELFVFAGIWNTTTDHKGNTLNSFSILTIDANEFMAEIHNSKNRMPLILTPDDAKNWLNHDLHADELTRIIKPLPSSEFKAHTIKKFVPANSKILDSSDIIAYYNYPHIPDIFTKPNTLF